MPYCLFSSLLICIKQRDKTVSTEGVALSSSAAQAQQTGLHCMFNTQMHMHACIIGRTWPSPSFDSYMTSSTHTHTHTQLITGGTRPSWPPCWLPTHNALSVVSVWNPLPPVPQISTVTSKICMTHHTDWAGSRSTLWPQSNKDLHYSNTDMHDSSLRCSSKSIHSLGPAYFTPRVKDSNTCNAWLHRGWNLTSLICLTTSNSAVVWRSMPSLRSSRRR